MRGNRGRRSRAELEDIERMCTMEMINEGRESYEMTQKESRKMNKRMSEKENKKLQDHMMKKAQLEEQIREKTWKIEELEKIANQLESIKSRIGLLVHISGISTMKQNSFV